MSNHQITNPIIPIIFRGIASEIVDVPSSSEKQQTITEKALLCLEMPTENPGTTTNKNPPKQTAEIIQKLKKFLGKDETSRVQIRNISKKNLTYNHIPAKVRSMNETATASSLGSSCSIGFYYFTHFYVVVDGSAESSGMNRGDVILNTLTYASPYPLPFPLLQPDRVKYSTKQSENIVGINTNLHTDRVGIWFILPANTATDAAAMELALGQFIQISLMPLCAAVSRKIVSNYWGGLDWFPGWTGIVVSAEIAALLGPEGGITARIFEQTGVKVVVEKAPALPPQLCDNMASIKTNDLLIFASISW